MTWGELQQRLASLDRKRAAGVAWRAALRVAPLVARAADEYGPEALEWLNATAAALRVVGRWVAGEAVSRFTLDLAADVCRSAAAAGANAARLLGSSKAGEDAELAFAAAAFAADACRATNTSQTAVMQGVRAADATGQVPREVVATDLEAEAYGPLWPDGEPRWSTDGWGRLEAAGLRLVVLGELGA